MMCGCSVSRTITVLPAFTAAEKYTLSLDYVNFLDYINFESQWSEKCRSRYRFHCNCLKNMSRTITLQGFILTATTAAEKFTFLSL